MPLDLIDKDGSETGGTAADKTNASITEVNRLVDEYGRLTAEMQMYVWVESDIGVAVSGVVQLADNITYWIMAPISTANTWKLGQFTVITSARNQNHNTLTFTGAKAFIATGVVLGHLGDINVIGNGTNQLFDFVSDTLGNFTIDNFGASNFGSLGNIDNVHIGWQRFGFTTFTTGITFNSGGYFGVDFGSFITTADTDIITMNGSFIATISISVLACATGSGGYVLNLDNALVASSIKASLLGISDGSIFNPAGLNQTSPLVQSLANDGVANSSVIGVMKMSENITSTSMTVIGQYEDVNGTFLEDTTERFTFADNALTYIGIEPTTAIVHVIVSQSKSGATANSVAVGVFKNASATPEVVPATGDVINRSSTVPLQIPVSLVTGDYIKVKHANMEAATDILMESLVCTIKA